MGPEAPIVFAVGTDLARSLIGPKGATVNDIQRRFGVRVDITRDGVEQQTVSLSGGHRDAALQDILKRVEGTIGQAVSSVHFVVPPESTSLIVGGQGSTVQRLQRESGAQIDVTKEPTSMSGAAVTIAGRIPQIVAAARLVFDIVATDRRNGGSPAQGGFVGTSPGQPVTAPGVKRTRAGGMERPAGTPMPKAQRTADGSVPLTLCIKGNAAGALVGPGGSVIKQLQSGSQAAIDIERGGQAIKAVTVRGDTEAKQRALQMVIEKLEEAQGVLSELSIMVPPGSATLIVGSKGSTINSLQQQTGTKIDIAKESRGETPGMVTIGGAKDQIIQAVARIDQLVNQDAGAC